MSEEAIFNTVLISMMIMFGLAMFIIILFNLSQRRILAEQSKIHDNKLAFQKQLVSSNLETQEKERSRIAKELHDDIGSKLNVVSLNMKLLKSTIGRGSNPTEILEDIESAIKSSIDRTRKISHELIPSSLSKFGLWSAIRSLTTDINKTGTLRMNVALGEELECLTKMKELHLYRIIQELTTNTIKHAQAKHIEIKSILRDDNLVLTYTDDGIGMGDVEKYKTGLGISNIEARTKILNATIVLVDQNDKGTKFEISVPLSNCTN